MRLLLCEDEIELSNGLVAILKHNRFSVDAVYDGQEALEYLSADNYDGLILDIMLPKIDGIEVLKKLRADGNDIPVLMLTAKSEIDDKVLGLDSGANDYLTKPFNKRELLARIRAMLRIKSDSVSHIIKYGNVSLDCSKYILFTDTGRISLASKEFQMIELLMVNPRQLISTDMFMEKVWGYDSEAEINVVWVFLSYLRKKLRQIDANINIKSSRGLGYSIEVVD